MFPPNLPPLTVKKSFVKILGMLDNSHWNIPEMKRNLITFVMLGYSWINN